MKPTKLTPKQEQLKKLLAPLVEGILKEESSYFDSTEMENMKIAIESIVAFSKTTLNMINAGKFDNNLHGKFIKIVKARLQWVENPSKPKPY